MTLSKEIIKRIAKHIKLIRNKTKNMLQDERKDLLQFVESHIMDTMKKIIFAFLIIVSVPFLLEARYNNFRMDLGIHSGILYNNFDALNVRLKDKSYSQIDSLLYTGGAKWNLGIDRRLYGVNFYSILANDSENNTAKTIRGILYSFNNDWEFNDWGNFSNKKISGFAKIPGEKYFLSIEILYGASQNKNKNILSK